MDDVLAENVFEDEPVITGDVSSEDEYEDAGDQTIADVAQSAKKLKKKRKFEEMREKKRMKLNEDASKSGDAVLNLTASQQCDLLTACDSLPGLQPNHFCAIDIKKKSPQTDCPFIAALESVLPSYRNICKKVPTEMGCPRIVIVCSSAGRAVDIIKKLSSNTKFRVGKLFAKHMKIQDQITSLKTHYPIVIGTPHRLSKLVELGALSLKETRMILIDMKRDLKSYNITTTPNVKEDFFQFLRGAVIPQLGGNMRLTLVENNS